MRNGGAAGGDVTTVRLAFTRARARAGLLVAIAATIAVLVFGLASVLGAIGSAMRAAVVAAVDAAPPDDRIAVLSIPLASNPDAQLAAANDLLARQFGDSLRAEQSTEGGSLRFTLSVDTDRLDPWSLPAIADDLRYLDRDARSVDGLAPQGASVSGGLAATLAGAAAAVGAVQAVVPVPLALVAIGGVIATVQLARLLGDARRGESTLLRARGLSTREARRAAVAEQVVVALVGAGLGWVAAAAAVAALGGAFGAALRTTSVIPAVTTIVLGVAAGLAAHRGAAPAPESGNSAAQTHASRHASPRSALMLPLAAGLAVLAAAFFVWQLRGLAASGSPAADAWGFAVTALGPALALAAASIVVLTLFAPAATARGRAAERRPGLQPALGARMIARHRTAFGVVVALVALAAGGSVMAGASTATWERVADQAAALTAGAQARAITGAEQVTPAAVAAVGVDGLAVAPVVSHAARVADLEATLIAIPDASAAAVLVPLPAAGIDPDAVQRALEHAPAGIELDASAERLTAAFDLRSEPTEGVTGWDEDGMPIFGAVTTLPDPSVLEGTAWLLAADGTPARVALTVEVTNHSVADGTLTAVGTIPAGTAPWTLVGIEAGYRNSAGSAQVAVTPITLDAGAPVPWPSTAPTMLDRSNGTVRVTFAPVPGSIPAVATRTVVDALGLTSGAEFDVRLDRSSRVVRARLAGIVDAVPGTTGDAAVLVPLGALTQTQFAASGAGLRADQVWASAIPAAAAPETATATANDPAQAAAALTAALPQARIDTGVADRGLTSSLTAAWWIATILGGLLAAVAIVASAIALARRRATDVFVLRAVGVTPGAQARGRFDELITVGVYALVAGMVLGAVVAWLTLPALTRAAVPGVPAVLANATAWGWLPPLVLTLLLAAAVAAASVLVRRAIAMQAQAGRVREGA